MNARSPVSKPLVVKPIAGHLGAEIEGVDLSAPIDGETRAAVLAAFQRHHLIVLRRQAISPEQHMAFSEIFGPVMDLPHIPKVPGFDFLHQVRREPGLENRRVPGEGWHTDSTFLPSPPAAVVMRAVDVPAYGGDTLFTSTTAAYLELSDGMRRLLDPLDAVHSATRVFGKESLRKAPLLQLREGLQVEEGERETVHPVVCRDPATGARHLFVNATYTQRLSGLSQEESRPILAFLCDHVIRPEFRLPPPVGERHRRRLGQPLHHAPRRPGLSRELSLPPANDNRRRAAGTLNGPRPQTLYGDCLSAPQAVSMPKTSSVDDDRTAPADRTAAPPTARTPWDDPAGAAATLGLEDFPTFRITRLATLLHRSLTRQYLDRYGVTVPEWRTLCAVAQWSPMSVGDLLKLSGYDKALISRSLHAMRDKGLVTLLPDPGHGRRLDVSVTAQGKALYERILPDARQRQAKLLELLSAQERRVLFGALTKLQEAYGDEPEPGVRPKPRRSGGA